MLKDMLNLVNEVTVSRKTETPDGMGGLTSTTISTTLSLASIWGVGNGNRYISEKIAKASTHLLAIEYGAYNFIDTDYTITYNSLTYKLTGHADNVANRNELVLIGLERIS